MNNPTPPVTPPRHGSAPVGAVKTGPRVGMIVTGLAITLLGLWIVAASLGFAVDEQLALILVLTIAGLSLLVGALVAALRRRNA